MQPPYRVLQVVTIMGRGGAETMIMNHYRALDKTKVQFDFLVHRQERGDYDDEIEKLGGHIYRTSAIRPWRYCSYFKFLDDFFEKHHDYVAIHSHIQENSGFVLKYALKHGITNLISHSHIADLGIDYKYIFRQYGKWVLNKYVKTRLACGVDAGKFLYGKKDFLVFKNAIDEERFRYNSQIRHEVRQALGIENKLVVGNVSRFNPQKNHTFIIDIFSELLKLKQDSVLLLVGDGYLRPAIEAKCDRLGIANKVMFLGSRSDVPELLQAFDVFLFPSLFEGLPVSIIEAQASGVQCMLSNTIDLETKVTDCVHFFSLAKSAKDWAKELYKFNGIEHINSNAQIIQSGYSLRTNLKKLMSIYGIE